MNMTILWFILLIAFAVIEIATMNLTSIWFVAGSLAALLCAIFGGSVTWQVILFVVVSGATLAIVRPLATKLLNVEAKPTNADRVFSMVGVVTEEIDNTIAKGAVTVGGKVWTARSLTGEIIKEGTYVRPKTIEGVKLIVEPVREDNNYSK